MTYSGKWALITGASAGIGETFARALAASGANLILTARRGDRLETLATDLEAQHNVKTVTIAADLTDPLAPAAIFEAIERHQLPVDILINNAGWGLPGKYTDNDWRAYKDYIALMVTSYAHLSRLALPGMQERGYGRVIMVSSLAGLVPGSSGHTLYGACKAFLISFAQSLAAENQETGVRVSALCPGMTYSEFHDVNGARDIVSKLPKAMFMDAAPVVDGALAAVERAHVIYVPGAVNKSIAWLAKALPRPWAAALMSAQSRKVRRQAG